MNWKNYFDRIYCIHNNDNNQDNIDELMRIGIFDLKIINIKNYALTKQFSDVKYFKDVAIIDAIKDASSNHYDNILIIRDDMKFIENINEIESAIISCNKYVFSILNDGDICEDCLIIRKPIIDYIVDFTIDKESYFDEDDITNSINYYNETHWNDTVKTYINENFKIKRCNIAHHKIDFVISYVNNNDKVWQEQYLACSSKISNSTLNNIQRWRDFGLFEYNIQLLNNNLSWINKIFIVVSTSSQIPSWVEKYNNVEIVLHKNFIPEEYLPTFNSCTIETFLCNISNLSEYFIYSNDDVFCINKLNKTDFFESGKLKLYVSNINLENKTNHVTICKNTFKLLLKEFNIDYFNEIKLDKHFKQLSHTPHPMLKSSGLHIHALYKTLIAKTVTTFRDDKNINQYIYSLYDYLIGNYKIHQINSVYVNVDNIDAISNACANNSVSILCINDNKQTYNDENKLISNIATILKKKIIH